jgi:hypothetical protein
MVHGNSFTKVPNNLLQHNEMVKKKVPNNPIYNYKHGVCPCVCLLPFQSYLCLPNLPKLLLLSGS